MSDLDINTSCYSQIHAGSVEVFLDLVNDYKIPVFQFFYRLFSDAGAAEGSAEKVFLRAFKMRKLLRSGTDLKGWMFRIACDLLRTGDCFPATKRTSANASRIEQVVLALPLWEKSALLLHRYAGLTTSQIALALRTTEFAAQDLLRRAYFTLTNGP
ncbi:MAG: hypothetical protein JSS87_14705 [Acidobacteria bacterium]|nr:hypothetical protein [Acidobacteriota bacterium]